MPTLQVRSFSQVLQRMVARVAARTRLSDFNDSSMAKQLLAATAREIDDLYFQLTRLTDLFDINTAQGDDLDARAKEIQPGTLRRLAARKAIGSVVFSRGSNTGQTLIIPTGTAVKSAAGQVYVTTSPAVITSTSAEVVSGHGVGRDSSIVSAIAQLAGSAGNLATGGITGLQGTPPGVSTVTNVTSMIGGSDREEDEPYRKRIRDFVNSLARGTIETLEFVARDVEDPLTGKRVLYSKAIEDVVDRGNVTLYVDDGAGTAVSTEAVTALPLLTALGGETYIQLENWPIMFPEGTVTLSITRSAVTTVMTQSVDWFLNPASGRIYIPAANFGGLIVGDEITGSFSYYTGLIAAVQKVIDGDPADRANYPGFRAAGVLVKVRSPQIVPIPVQANLTVRAGYDAAAVASAASDAVLTYINQLGISADVIRAEIIDQIMEIEGVYDVNLIAPAANHTILDDELPRAFAGSVNIS